MTKQVALYLRISHSERTVENQNLDLQKLADSSDWEVVEVYQGNRPHLQPNGSETPLHCSLPWQQ